MRSSIHSRSERARSAGALALVVVLLLPGLARAAVAGAGDAETRARQHFAEGTLAYDLGEFQKALQAYSEAYRLAPRPALLFNVAQCHRQLGQDERAAFFYRRYLYLAGPEAADADLARELLAEVETRALRQGERTASPAPDAPVLARPESRSRQKAPAARAEARPGGRRGATASPPAEKKADPGAVDERTARLHPPASEAAPAVPAVRQEREPLTRKWWLWASVGAAALLTGGIIYAASTSGSRPTTLGNVPAH